MRTTLIITTYNRPVVLQMILESVERQSVLPDEVVIADDGSGPETAELILKMQDTFPIPLIHERQEDEGFRVARVRNLGASVASGDYLIFVDGDMILHHEFVKSHLRFARKGAFLHGPRVLLPKRLTRKVLSDDTLPRIHLLNIPMSHRFNTIHSPFLAGIFTKTTQRVKSRACNLSIYKSDYIAVNGFNEEFVGWGEEDSEFAWRLLESGIAKVNIRFCAVQYHLDHGHHNEVANEAAQARNIKLFAQVRDNRTIWCQKGYDQHIGMAAPSEPARMER